MSEQQNDISGCVDSFVMFLEDLGDQLEDEKFPLTRTENVRLTSKQCRALYPVKAERDIYRELENGFGSIANAESILSLCNRDFELAQSIAKQAVSLFHFDANLVEELHERFGGDLRKGIDFLNIFKESFQRDLTTDDTNAALHALAVFHNDEEAIFSYFTLFENDLSRALTFLENFNDKAKVLDFLEKFDNNGQQASAYLEKFQGSTDEASQFLGRFRGRKEADDFLESFSNNVEEAKRNKRKEEEEEEERKWTEKMKPLLELFDEDKGKTKKFFDDFCGSVSDAVIFVRKFENSELAEAHLTRINEQFDKKRIILVEMSANGFLMRKQKRCSEEVGK